MPSPRALVSVGEKSGPRSVLVEMPTAVQGCSYALTTGAGLWLLFVGRPNYRVDRCPDFASRAVHSGEQLL